MREKKSFKGLNTEFMEWMESENKPIRFLVPENDV